MVMWPIQISTIETQPTVSWVTLSTRQDSTKAQPDRRTARSDPLTESAPRDARTCSSTASTVLVPNSHASRVCGASVRSTSQSGTTTLSNTWLEESTPLQIARVRKPLFLRAAGVTCTSAPVGSSTFRPIAGRKEIITALTSNSAAVMRGTAMMASRVPMPSATPAVPAPSV